MIALTTSNQPRQTNAHHAEFLDMLPLIQRYARLAFSRYAAEARAEAVQEVVANAWQAYARLVQQGRAELAYSTVLAKYAIAQVREGRRVGSRLRIHDVSSEYARQKRGLQLERLDEFDRATGDWREVLVEDRRATPAEIAACRIDFAAWFKSLPKDVRRIAKALAAGETTTSAARRFGVSCARISQLRRQLKMSWAAFVGEASTPLRLVAE
jgi:hypothetical protein